MSVHRFRKGLDIPIAGAPARDISAGPATSRVALVADDFHGLKPRLDVEVGQRVRRGTVLCKDAGIPGVCHTAPAAGRVLAINRGARRALQSIVIELSDGERDGAPSADELEAFDVPGGGTPERCDPAELRDVMVRSGLWTAFRTRPFGKVPVPDGAPSSIFVTATDTNPLAADPDAVLAGTLDELDLGLRAVAALHRGTTYLCVHAGSALVDQVRAPVQMEEFAGPHPAGTAGLHIHTLEPVGRNRSAWTIGYQDVVSIGRLLSTGYLDASRIISLAGPALANPRLVKTRVGCSIADFEGAEQVEGPVRWISGSVISGKAAHGEAFGYMGRYDIQVTVLPEGGEREFLSWLSPGTRRFSILPVFLSRFLKGAHPTFSTDAHGAQRAIMPLGLFERVMPFDIPITYLLRALAVDDVERAEELGCLELDEEDLALCSFVDPGKADFGPMLRRNLELIERGQ